MQSAGHASRSAPHGVINCINIDINQVVHIDADGFYLGLNIGVAQHGQRHFIHLNIGGTQISQFGDLLAENLCKILEEVAGGLIDQFIDPLYRTIEMEGGQGRHGEFWCRARDRF